MKVYLKGLDTLRAIAAFVVVFGHIELFKQERGYDSILTTNISYPNGHIGVVLFFVLSGFLITFLLVGEYDQNQKISLKRFYLRRIFRVWPLFYLILILSWSLLNYHHNIISILLTFSIFPNIAQSIGEGWQGSPQLWSIGVEEQFYLFWPLIFIFLLRYKKVIHFLILFFIGFTFLPHFIDYINVHFIMSDDLAMFTRHYFFLTNFNSMAIGSLVGLLYARNISFLKIISNFKIGLSIIIFTLFFWLGGVNFKYFTNEFFSILFALSIYSLVSIPNLKIDTTVSIFLGKISYGIYMFHWIILELIFIYMPKIQNAVIFNMYVYIMTFGITILISWISFNTFERFFLKLKNKFAIVKT